MSWEGSEIVVCENGHMYYTDPYVDVAYVGSKCSECDGKIVLYELLDYTNGDKAEKIHNKKVMKQAKRAQEKMLKKESAKQIQIEEILKRKENYLNTVTKEAIEEKCSQFDKEIEVIKGI